MRARAEASMQVRGAYRSGSTRRKPSHRGCTAACPGSVQSPPFLSLYATSCVLAAWSPVHSSVELHYLALGVQAGWGWCPSPHRYWRHRLAARSALAKVTCRALRRLSLTPTIWGRDGRRASPPRPRRLAARRCCATGAGWLVGAAALRCVCLGCCFSSSLKTAHHTLSVSRCFAVDMAHSCGAENVPATRPLRGTCDLRPRAERARVQRGAVPSTHNNPRTPHTAVTRREDVREGEPCRSPCTVRSRHT